MGNSIEYAACGKAEAHNPAQVKECPGPGPKKEAQGRKARQPKQAVGEGVEQPDRTVRSHNVKKVDGNWALRSDLGKG